MSVIEFLPIPIWMAWEFLTISVTFDLILFCWKPSTLGLLQNAFLNLYRETSNSLQRCLEEEQTNEIAQDFQKINDI